MKRFELIPTGYERWKLNIWTAEGVLLNRSYHASIAAAFERIREDSPYAEDREVEAISQ
jgi:hypothetical protein